MLAAKYLTRAREDTKRFIDFSPTVITLRKYTRENDGTGGRKRTPAGTRSPQTFTLIEPGSSNYSGKLTVPEGTNTPYDFMLLGEWNASIELDDEFTHNGKIYRVQNILPENGYETRAMILTTGVPT